MSNIIGTGRPITDIIRDLQDGAIVGELTQAWHKLIAAVLDTRKAGKMKLTLEAKPTGKGTVEIHVDFEAKEPEHDRPGTTFFVTRDQQLVRHDPNQPKLPLQEVVPNRQTAAE